MDKRYQDFLGSSSARKVLGYDMRVARLDDVLQGKVWAYQDESRRKSKRQKDLADIIRITEAYPAMVESLPDAVKLLIRE